MNTNYRYFVTFGFETKMPVNQLNLAFNCNMKDYLDEYVTDEFKLSLDEDFVFVYFKSIENREFVRTIINKVTNAICANAIFSTFVVDDDNDDE